MANLSFILMMISCLSIAMQIGGSHSLPSETEEFRNFYGGREKLTKLHFYVQDTAFVPNRAVWDVARANITTMENMLFGQINIVDCNITAEPASNSTLLGRVHRLATTSDFNTFAMTMDLNYYFTAGKYNGITISVVGRNQILNVTRELPVVSGTAQFRLDLANGSFGSDLGRVNSGRIFRIRGFFWVEFGSDRIYSGSGVIRFRVFIGSGSCLDDKIVGSMPSNATQRMLSEDVVLVIMKYIIIRQLYVSLFTGSHWYS
ncbi:hypothetical protein OROMI_027744 [Orobanche minor]